ncbi:MAG: radical SAM protein, partial [Candidatus Omnitrophica bacterium]|nr:radical SAM protein [Candidatus Omnitrophota bacterium]
ASEISLGDLKTSDMPHRNPFLTYEVSRGCPNRCYYCANSLSVFQYKKVAQVISEIKKLSRINKTRKLVFVGPEINFNNIYLAELMAKLVPLNIQWTSYAVPRCLSKELLSGMKEAGCRLLSLGLESADQNTLDAIGKRTNVEEVSRIMHDCHDLGIKTQVHIIVGFPHEKSEDIRKIQKFILINRKVITNINISNLDIPKDSRILSDLDCKGIVLDGLDEGDYFSFYEKGRSSVEKRAEISARVKKLYHFIGKLQLSVFTEGTSFDESFGGLYLQSLGLDSDGHLHEPLKRRK